MYAGLSETSSSLKLGGIGSETSAHAFAYRGGGVAMACGAFGARNRNSGCRAGTELMNDVASLLKTSVGIVARIRPVGHARPVDAHGVVEVGTAAVSALRRQSVPGVPSGRDVRRILRSVSVQVFPDEARL